MTRCMKIKKGICWGLVLSSVLLLIAAPVGGSQLEEPESDLLPDVFVPFDTENGSEYVLVVEKETQSLFLFEIASSPKKIHQWACSTGKQIGAKTRSGDGKTPEGIYFFTAVHEDKELAPIYGIRAFPTDYPNLLDRLAERTGSAIWLHGTNKPLKARDSNGCIALDNADLENVGKYISLNRTPIIVVDKLDYEAFEPKTALREDVLELVHGWTDAVENGTYQDYVRFYDPEYVPDIAWWSEWYKIKKRFRDTDAAIQVEARNIAIYKHKAVVVVLLDQYVRFSDRDIPAGTKKFFLSDKGDGLRIIGENYQSLPDDYPAGGGENPLLVAAGDLRIPGPDAAEIEQMLEEWLKAWSSMDVDDYGSFYAKDFRSQGMDKESWLAYKKRLNKKYDYIRVSKRDLETEIDEDRSKVTFVQNYESSGFQASGLKTLLLKRENGEWKIFRETWSKM